MLKHKYYLVRHGFAFSNELGIIVSNIQNDSPKYGLTPRGKQQCSLACELFLLQSKNTKTQKVILYSPFVRSKQTAETLNKHIKADYMVQSELLGERFMGDIELKSNQNASLVWAEDSKNSGSNYQNSESCNQVLSRMREVIAECEKSPQQCEFFLVSHADPINILDSWMRGFQPGQHRSIPKIRNGEIRALN
jgi:glucosyl-3-phosphoglycerate phosphatase